MNHYAGQFWKCESCGLGGPDRTQGERRAERVAQSSPIIAESILWKVMLCNLFESITKRALQDHD